MKNCDVIKEMLIQELIRVNEFSTLKYSVLDTFFENFEQDFFWKENSSHLHETMYIIYQNIGDISDILTEIVKIESCIHNIYNLIGALGEEGELDNATESFLQAKRERLIDKKESNEEDMFHILNKKK